LANGGQNLKRRISLDKQICKQAAVAVNGPILTLDQLVPVRIQVRQPLQILLFWNRRTGQA
jgi:hypothetical protein